jgi:hypothetical protein
VLVFGVHAASAMTNYTLSVTRGIVLLRDKQLYTDSLDAPKGYKFYEYYKNCKNCDIIISIKVMNNNPFRIFVNHNTTERFVKEHSSEKPDFSFMGRGEENFVISAKDLEKKNFSNDQTYFFIEVHSFRMMNYTISVHSDTMRYDSLFPGLPSEYKIKNDEHAAYFLYTHNNNKSFYIHVQEAYGFTHILANPYKSYKGSIEDHFPTNQSDAKWHTYVSNDRNQLEIKTSSKDYCLN